MTTTHPSSTDFTTGISIVKGKIRELLFKLDAIGARSGSIETMLQRVSANIDTGLVDVFNEEAEPVIRELGLLEDLYEYRLGGTNSAHESPRRIEELQAALHAFRVAKHTFINAVENNRLAQEGLWLYKPQVKARAKARFDAMDKTTPMVKSEPKASLVKPDGPTWKIVEKSEAPRAEASTTSPSEDHSWSVLPEPEPKKPGLVARVTKAVSSRTLAKAGHITGSGAAVAFTAVMFSSTGAIEVIALGTLAAAAPLITGRRLWARSTKPVQAPLEITAAPAPVAVESGLTEGIGELHALAARIASTELSKEPKSAVEELLTALLAVVEHPGYMRSGTVFQSKVATLAGPEATEVLEQCSRTSNSQAAQDLALASLGSLIIGARELLKVLERAELDSVTQTSSVLADKYGRPSSLHLG